ncbi:hypothetical protein BLX24_07550 [Arsenicibacter rosenii]|uniref:Putative restriction endonuclease domain-containing protein n=1 Tax=Arsenicibacter rosenii TaxID=1750698 RepID=A0A1S2VLS9_9BACT|nr:hypothetical protein BLX24_07550 [Arsenicibacter rosenii]
MIVPLHIPHVEQFTDDELASFCTANPGLHIERDEHGMLFIDMSPTYLLTSSNNSELNGELIIWNRRIKAGKVIDSNGGFFLPDRSMRAPDVAWIKRDRWDALSTGVKKSIPYLVPDFVLELASDTDNLNQLHDKMGIWLKNGVRLGWLVSPRDGKTFIYKPDAPVVTKLFTETLTGDDVLIGFETILADILEL